MYPVPVFLRLASTAVLALCAAPSWAAPISIRQVAVPGASAPGGGTYSGIDFTGPLGAPAGEVFFRDGNTAEIIGQPGSLTRLNVTAATISGLSLGAGETITSNGGISVLGTPTAGQHLVQVKITTPNFQNTALVYGPPGAFAKILRTGDTLPGTTATWTPTRTSPSFFVQEDLPTTRNGDPMIKAVTANDAHAYIGLYRNGAWENTQVVGITPPGFGAGSNFNIQSLIVRAGNSAGQFVFDANIFTGASLTSNGGAYLGQNGSLQLMVKTGDVLPGDPRPVAGSFLTGSINNSGTVALAATYAGGLDGFVYRWSAAGGATKVISQGDPIPSIGPRAVFKGPVGFQLPLINASGAVLFVGNVQVGGASGNGNADRAALLYQSAPGAPVVKIAMHGDAIPGLPEGTVAIFTNTDVVNFNDAGQIAFFCGSPANTTAASRPGGVSTILSGGTAPDISVIAREDTPAPIVGLGGSRTFIGLTRPNAGSLLITRVSGESGAILSDQGGIAFRGTLPGGFFGTSTVFQARLNETQTSPLVAQTINFPQPFARAAAAGMVTLAATSSSGLPVTYAVVSGPATLAGNVLSFSGSTGNVLVRATQAGDASFLAAETIDRTVVVTSDATLLPPPGSAALSPLMLPRSSGPGATYSGIDSSDPLIFPDGAVDFKDAVTNDVITTATSPVRLDFSSGTTMGVTAPPGESLDSGKATVLGITASGQVFARAFLRPLGSFDETKRVIAGGTPGNFTKLLQTGDALPGTTSIYGSTSIPGAIDPPPNTRGGLPWVIASAANGQSSHIGIYRNGAWEKTQILGVTPPGGYSAGTKFSGPQFTAANSAGEFLFASGVANSSNVRVGGGWFYGKNGGLSLIAFDGTTLGGDARPLLSLESKSINAAGEAAFHGSYRAVSGNSDQGGFIARWTPAGGFTSVLKRGDFLTFLGPNIVFDASQRAPLISDTGALVMLAQIADRNPGTGALTNRRLALLHQAGSTAAVEKILVTGEVVPGSPVGFGNLLAGSPSGTSFLPSTAISLQLDNSGHIAVFAGGAANSSTYTIVFGGTLPNLAYVMKNGWVDIKGAGTRLITISGTSVDGVSGEPGSRLGNAGEFVFRGSYSNIGVSTSDTGVFKASVLPPPPVPVAQAITFPNLADRIVHSAAFDPGATSDSGLAITYQVISGPAAVSGNLLIPGAISGLVTVRASQSGNASFLAAAAVERSFRLVGNASELAMSEYLDAANVPPADRLATVDLDNDGLVNLLEFALGGNPLSPDVGELPTARIIDGILHFTYTRAQGATVVYTVKTSPDLAAPWNAAGVNQGIPDQNGITTATLTLSSGAGGFLRLEVNLAP